MLTKVDLRDFLEINQGLYGELPASARQVAMMRVLVEAFSLAPADASIEQPDVWTLGFRMVRHPDCPS
jgi:hypothetical protein